MRFGMPGFVSVSSEYLAADALASMTRVISDTGLRGVITSAESLSPASGVNVGFASVSGEILSGGLSALGTDTTSVSGTKGRRLALLKSAVTVGLFVGDSGKALLLCFVGVEVGFASASGEILSGGLLALGTDNTSVSGTKGR